MRPNELTHALFAAGVISALVTLVALTPPSPHDTGQAQTVTLFASATDKAGRPVEDLTASDFALKENGRVQPILSAAIDRSPITLVLLVDRSGSMTPQIPKIDAMAQAIVDGLQNGDRARVGQIDKALALNPPGFSTDRAELSRTLRQFSKPFGSTNLWHGLDATIAMLEAERGYRAVLIVSDGYDTSSIVPRSEVVKHAQAAGVVVHGIEVAVALPPQMAQMSLRAPELKPLTEDVGGGYWRLPSGGDAEVLVGQVNAGLRSRYAITFAPSGASGKMQSLELRTTRRDVTVRFPKKYVPQISKVESRSPNF